MMRSLKGYFSALALGAGVVLGSLGVTEYSLGSALKTDPAVSDTCRTSMDSLCSLQTMFHSSSAPLQSKGMEHMVVGGGLLTFGLARRFKRK